MMEVLSSSEMSVPHGVPPQKTAFFNVIEIWKIVRLFFFWIWLQSHVLETWLLKSDGVSLCANN
jgi:hypothetical protein